MRMITPVIMGFLFATNLFAEDPDVSQIVERVVDRTQQNLEADDHVGSYQTVAVKKLKGDEVKQEETKTYRTIWIQDKPYSELVQINFKNLNAKQKKEESKRKSEFVKALYRPSKPKGIHQELRKVEWWNLHHKYDFTLLPSEGYSGYILGFRPKNIKLEESTRAERILNHLAGKIWVDPEYNVVKAETYLASPVKFAWGIAKLEQMNVEFHQQQYGRMQVPAWLHIRFKACAGIFRTEHQDITATWFDVFTKSDARNASPAESK